MTKVILTCFAGRRENLEIMFRYTDVLVSRGILHEVHLWNFTRLKSDDIWLRESFDALRKNERSYIRLFHPKIHVKKMEHKPPKPDTSSSIRKNRDPPLRRQTNTHQVSLVSTWEDYYKHYTQELYPNHVIIKCDDDIVFFDIDAFDGFIKRRIENTDNLCAFASIVNNGVAAYAQQKAGLIPKKLGDFPYDSVCGKLWENGYLATSLQEYFINNRKEWLSKAHNLSGQMYQHPIGDRISINFFAILSKDLHVFQEIGPDDECELSIAMALKYNRAHYIDLAFTVAHMSFYRQRETGLDEEYLQKRYTEIAP